MTAFAGASEPMNCMEVWGGNGSTESSLARPGLDIWVWCKSHHQSQIDGGDLCLLTSCASGRITRMLLADICSRGPVFADLAAQLRDLMTCNANSIKQARLLREMHQRFESFSARGGFATALVSTYFAPTRSFAVCNAGHPAPLVYRSESREWSVLKQVPAKGEARAIPVPGVVDEDEYQWMSIKLDTEDMVLGYNNVLAECRDADGRILGSEGLLQQVQQTDSDRPGEILPALVSRLNEWNLEQLSTHDATLLLCRATDRPVGWRNNLLAPWRWLRGVQDRTRLV